MPEYLKERYLHHTRN